MHFYIITHIYTYIIYINNWEGSLAVGLVGTPPTEDFLVVKTATRRLARSGIGSSLSSSRKTSKELVDAIFSTQK